MNNNQMVNRIPNHLIHQLSELIASVMGIHFDESRWHDLERLINKAVPDFGFSDTESLILWLISNPLTKKQIELLAGHLTIGETFFFRNKEYFEILEEHILPELIRSRQSTGKYLRIWSAGCSSGEEPYSIAILLDKMNVNVKDWNITILATDINPRVLKKATEGIYSDWSFRGTPQWVKGKYFKKAKNNTYEIRSDIKQMITFGYLNLVEGTYPSVLNNTNAMDIIFCRNVLMYFSPEQIGKSVQGIYQSLKQNGWLFVSPAEASNILSRQFETLNLSDTIVYRKSSGKSQINEAAPSVEIPSFSSFREDDAVPSFDFKFNFDPKTDISVPQVKIAHEDEEPKKPKKKEPVPDSYEKAKRMFEKGFYGEVSELLQRHVLDHPGDARSTVLLARSYANLGDLPDARKWCEKAIETEILNPSHYYLFASILQEQGQFEEVITILKKAIYLDPKFVMAYFFLADTLQKKGEAKASVKHFKNVAELLAAYKKEDVLPESEGLTAGRLSEIIAFKNA